MFIRLSLSLSLSLSAQPHVMLIVETTECSEEIAGCHQACVLCTSWLPSSPLCPHAHRLSSIWNGYSIDRSTSSLLCSAAFPPLPSVLSSLEFRTNNRSKKAIEKRTRRKNSLNNRRSWLPEEKESRERRRENERMATTSLLFVGWCPASEQAKNERTDGRATLVSRHTRLSSSRQDKRSAVPVCDCGESCVDKYINRIEKQSAVNGFVRLSIHLCTEQWSTVERCLQVRIDEQITSSLSLLFAVDFKEDFSHK